MRKSRLAERSMFAAAAGVLAAAVVAVLFVEPVAEFVRAQRVASAGLGVVVLVFAGYIVELGWNLRAQRIAASQLVPGEFNERVRRKLAEPSAARRFKAESMRALSIDSVDTMTGPQFEEYAAFLFEHYEYAVERTGGSGDQGCDLILSRGGERIACQVKRYSEPVSNRAVQEAVGAIKHYKCTAAMVITTSSFTQSARELAFSNGCRLIDREMLSRMAADFRAGLRRLSL